MSKAFALIRFRKTGNIYYGIYNGTVDMLSPKICTPEECYDPSSDCYCAISYLEDTLYDYYEYPEDADWDIVDIYSDYGYGFYWEGVGSESLELIKEGCMPWEEYDYLPHGKPQWVEEFLNN